MFDKSSLFVRIAACLLLAALALGALASCGSTVMSDSSLLDMVENDILGRTQDEILEIDPKITVKKNHMTEKDMDDGSHRVRYVIAGDAFVAEGKWMTTVLYYFKDGVCTSYAIEYRQADYSEGQCAKRMTMFTDYLNSKYGAGEEARIKIGNYLVLGTAWKVNEGILEMSRQNGGWILLTYRTDD